MADIQSIHDRIADIVDTVSVSIIPVKYRYPEAKPSSFPAVMTLFAGDAERMIDTITNEQTMLFDIVTVFPVDESNTAYQKWLNLYDALKAEFRKDDHQTLSGDAVYFMVDASGRPTFSDEYSQPVAVLSIRVTAKVLQSITA